MKTLEKSEMLERNKVGRVLTEEGILNQGRLHALLDSESPTADQSASHINVQVKESAIFLQIGSDASVSSSAATNSCSDLI